MSYPYDARELMRGAVAQSRPDARPVRLLARRQARQMRRDIRSV